MKPQFVAPAPKRAYDPAQYKAWYEKNAEKKRAYALQYYSDHREERLAKAKAYGEQNKDRILEKNRKYMYGIDGAAVEKLLADQKGCCAICRAAFDSTRKGTKPHVDHDHNSGAVRGLLCQKCNLAIGVVERPGFLEKAIQYLGGTKQ